MKIIVSALALAVLFTGVVPGTADAAKKKAAPAAAATCTTPAMMRDESRLWTCWPLKQAKN